jgi:hypothetical protein
MNDLVEVERPRPTRNGWKSAAAPTPCNDKSSRAIAAQLEDEVQQKWLSGAT